MKNVLFMNFSSVMKRALFCCCSLPLFYAQQVMADEAHYAEDYQFITHDGAWCWFSDPRAIYVNDIIIGGYVDDEGSIWAFSYDPQTQERKATIVHAKLNYDDHATPSVMKLADNRIVIFYSAHGGTKNSPMYYRISKHPADVTAWEEERRILPDRKGQFGICYSNAAQLSAENGRTYLFFRGSDFKPNFVVSDDLKNWSEGYTLVKNDEGYGNGGRPYTKITTNHKDKIFFAFTDAHPRGRATNSIYFMMYKKGKLCKASGEVISESIYTPVSPSQADKVYDATKTFDKAWIWDVAFDKDENPVIVYARFADADNSHSYWYAYWNGKKWENRRIASAGNYFMRNEKYADKGFIEHENNYSGGVILDHNDPSIVYTSRPVNGIFEIEKWQYNARTKKWTTEAVTAGSERDNIRPFVVRDYKEGQPHVLWAYNYKYPHFKVFESAIRINQVAKSFDASLNKKSVMEVACKVADWQIRDYDTHPFSSIKARDWKSGVLCNGLFDWAELYKKESGSDKYFNFLKRVYNRENWAPGNRVFHADDICISQMYLDMYQKSGKKNVMLPTLARTEWVVEHLPEDKMDYRAGSSRWTWCDALYMAPAVYTRLYAITGDKKFLKFFDREFKATYEHLYDKEAHLFYRDSKYFDKKEKNGAKVFWGRGNGWVLGGLAEILKTLPQKEKKYRAFYTQLYREMAESIVNCQDANGYWHASLLDRETYADPETSSTGLIIYALAYGVNAGLLENDKYMPVVKKGWEALVKAVDTEGKLGWVQPVGQNPKKIEKGSTEVYGVGGFLMTAAEIMKMVK